MKPAEMTTVQTASIWSHVIPSGAKIVTTASSDDAVSVSWTTNDSLSKVSDFYKTKLADSDWEIIQTATLDNATVFGIGKKGVEGAVAISETEEGTSIIVTLDLKGE